MPEHTLLVRSSDLLDNPLMQWLIDSHRLHQCRWDYELRFDSSAYGGRVV